MRNAVSVESNRKAILLVDPLVGLVSSIILIIAGLIPVYMNTKQDNRNRARARKITVVDSSISSL